MSQVEETLTSILQLKCLVSEPNMSDDRLSITIDDDAVDQSEIPTAVISKNLSISCDNIEMNVEMPDEVLTDNETKVEDKSKVSLVEDEKSAVKETKEKMESVEESEMKDKKHHKHHKKHSKKKKKKHKKEKKEKKKKEKEKANTGTRFNYLFVYSLLISYCVCLLVSLLSSS